MLASVLCKQKYQAKLLQKYVDNSVDKVENSVFKPFLDVDDITKMLH